MGTWLYALGHGKDDFRSRRTKLASRRAFRRNPPEWPGRMKEITEEDRWISLSQPSYPSLIRYFCATPYRASGG